MARSDLPTRAKPGPVSSGEQGGERSRVPVTLAVDSAENEWLAQLVSPNSRRAYAADVRDFCVANAIRSLAELCAVRRAQVLSWRLQLQASGASSATQRRKLSALASLFAYLCERQLIDSNPVVGVRRPAVAGYQGQTPALSPAQATALLNAPDGSRPKGLRDRAILALLLYQGLRRSELSALNVSDLHQDRGAWRLRVQGKGQRIRMLPVNPEALARVQGYLASRSDLSRSAPMFLALRNARGDGRLSPQSVYSQVVRRYGAPLGLTDLPWFGPHVMRATAATQALEQGVDLGTVQHWLGHASIQTTRAYDRRDLAVTAMALKLDYG